MSAVQYTVMVKVSPELATTEDCPECFGLFSDYRPAEDLQKTLRAALPGYIITVQPIHQESKRSEVLAHLRKLGYRQFAPTR